MTEQTKIDDGGQAFPRPASTDTFNDENYAPQRGMTLRDWFAGQVLAGYAALPDERSHRACDGDPAAWRAELRKHDAEYCYQMADAMLKARKQ